MSKKSTVKNLDNDKNIKVQITQENNKNLDGDVKKEKIQKDSEKYKIILKLLNKILKNNGKDEITDITKFADIDRDDIIKDVNRQALKEMEDDIYKLYDKKKCGYYNKSKGTVLNCLRGMMRDSGFEFNYENKEVYKNIDGKRFRKTLFLYSIK